MPAGPSRTARGVRAVSAAGLYLEGVRLLRREPGLRRLARVPVLLALACFALAVGLFITFAGELYTFATGWLPALTATHWYDWLWVAPGQLLFLIVGAALFLALLAAGFVAAFLVANVLAAPFLDVLSQRVERIERGLEGDEEGGGLWGVLRDGARSIVEELRRLVFFLAVQASILAASFLIPGAQPLAPIAMTLFAVLFLPLEYAGYSLDRRRLSFRDKRRWVWSHASGMLSFGGLAFLVSLVPGLNFLALPVLVVAGTLLVLRLPPEPRSSRPA